MRPIRQRIAGTSTVGARFLTRPIGDMVSPINVLAALLTAGGIVTHTPWIRTQTTSRNRPDECRMVWLQLTFVAGLVAVLAVAVRRRRSISTSYPDPDMDVGAVSEGWLAEQRGSKDSS